jgi:hypothetical protein
VHFRGAAALRENTSRLLQPKNGALVCAPPPSDFLGPLLSMSNAPATNSPTSLVTQPVPDFTAAAVMPNNEIVEHFNLKSYLAGHYGLVFFYPLDFSFVFFYFCYKFITYRHTVLKAEHIVNCIPRQCFSFFKKGQTLEAHIICFILTEFCKAIGMMWKSMLQENNFRK